MRPLKKALLLLLLPLMAFTTAHKFYVSVTNVAYSEKDRALQIKTRIFIDDMDALLWERYEIRGNLATHEESEKAADYIEKYLRAKLAVQVNGADRPFTFLAKKYDNDVMICYLEVPEIDMATTASIEITNEVLTDLFEDQQNVVHFKIDGKKKSFVLMRYNNKGMLNL